MKKKPKSITVRFDKLGKKYAPLYNALYRIVAAKKRYGLGKTSVASELADMALRGLALHVESGHIVSDILAGKLDAAPKESNPFYTKEVLEDGQNELHD